jgi:hypothetical protein
MGCEVGVSARATFDDGAKLLRESRKSMEGGISPFYVAAHRRRRFIAAEIGRPGVLLSFLRRTFAFHRIRIHTGVAHEER